MTKNELQKFDNFQANNQNRQLDFKQSNLNDLFNQFIVFIDASPNTIRTYSNFSKTIEFLYLRENSIIQPTPQIG